MAHHLTSTELCELLEISTKTLYLWERSGKIPKPKRDRRGWRTFSPRQVESIRRFADPARHRDRAAVPPAGRRDLGGLTARNQIQGTVVSIATEGLLSEVVLRLGDGQEIVSVVTSGSVRRLDLKKGQGATAVIKATEVMLFK